MEVKRMKKLKVFFKLYFWTEYDKLNKFGRIMFWINLLNYGSYEDIGKAVLKALLEKETEKDNGSYRSIIVGGS